MCRAVTCKKCNKPSWAGCGAHVESVLGHVPRSERCACRDAATRTPAAGAVGTGLGATIRRWFRGSSSGS